MSGRWRRTDRLPVTTVARAILRLAPAVLLALAGTTGVHADCDARPITPAEKAMIESTLASLARITSQVPAGWELDGESEQKAPSHLCVGQEDAPLTVHFRRRFVRTAGLEAAQAEAQARETAAGEAWRARRAAGGAEQREAAVMKKLEALATRIGKAAEAGNAAEVERLSREMEKLQVEMEGLADASGEQEAVKEFEAAQNALDKDRVIEITVTANPSQVSVLRMKPIAVPGAAKAFRGERDLDDRDDNEQALVLFGDFRPSATDALSPARHPRKPYTAIHAVAVKIFADKDRLPALLDQVDAAGFAALVR